MLSTILEDDGRGFEVEATLASQEKARRLGLRGMRERVDLLGGELEIESSPRRGHQHLRLHPGRCRGRRGGNMKERSGFRSLDHDRLPAPRNLRSRLLPADSEVVTT